MIKAAPDHTDAELVLKLYDLRREAVMREARSTLLGKFWPKSYGDFLAITKLEHPMNAAFRQVSSYWEMAYSFAKHGIVNPDFLAENAGEGLFLFAKILPYVEQYRKEVAPLAFQNTEWIATNCDTGRTKLSMLKARVELLSSTQHAR